MSTIHDDSTPVGHDDILPVEAPHRPLWRNGDFLKFWMGQTISLFGSQVTFIALPLIAASTLQATPSQMAFLLAIGYAPATVIGLFAGAWVDRLRRKPIMIWADIGRAAFLLALPIAATLGFLQVEQLYIVAFLNGILGTFFGSAYGAFLPTLVLREQRVVANSRLSTSASVAGIAGPGLAGVLVQLFTAPVAVTVDALSFLISALSLGLIRSSEPASQQPSRRAHIWAEMRDGLRVNWRDPFLRAFQLSSAANDIFWNMVNGVYILYVTRTVGLPPSAIGLIFGIGSGGALVGSLLAGSVSRRLGFGRGIISAQIMVGCIPLLIPLAIWLPTLALPLLVTTEALVGCANTVFCINRDSLIQTVTPNRLLGRVGASRSFIGLGVATVGVCIGGLLAERIGVPATVVIGCCGEVPAFLWLLLSPVRALRELPMPMADGAAI